MTEYTAPEDVWPKKGSSGSSTEVLYSVQARLAYFQPETVCGHLLDTRWKRIYFEKGPVGVPSGPASNGTKLTSLHDYAAAQALRWWFHAQADAERSFSCLETRIVAHKVTCSWSEEAVSAHVLIGGEDRSSMMPDWGSKTPAKQPAPDITSHSEG